MVQTKRYVDLDGYYFPLQLSLLTHQERYSKEYKEDTPLPAMQKVIAPLLQNVLSAFAYRGRKDSFFLYGQINYPLDLNNYPFLNMVRGRYVFDLTQDCITGYADFWNAWSFRRGSVIILLPHSFNFSEIFKQCCRPELLENPNTGNTVSATKNAKPK